MQQRRRDTARDAGGVFGITCCSYSKLGDGSSKILILATISAC